VCDVGISSKSLEETNVSPAVSR